METPIFYKLTEQGQNEVIRQGLHFSPDEIELPLPRLIKDILQIIESYKNQYGYAPCVEIRGAMVGVKNWQSVVAYDETHHLLALHGQSDEGDLVWVSPLFPALFGSSSRNGKLRLRPGQG